MPPSPVVSDSSIQFADYVVHVPGLHGVPKHPEVFSARDTRRASWYVIGTYTSLPKFKPALFEKDSGLPDLGAKRSWDLHHVVEGQHFAWISFQGDDFPRMYKRVLPCVLLDSFEHKEYYNDLLHGPETKELLGLHGSMSKEARARLTYLKFCAAKRTGHAAALAELKDMLDRMTELYANTYEHSPVLRRIAANVFAAAARRLRD
jgi:hypothetical protein